MGRGGAGSGLPERLILAVTAAVLIAVVLLGVRTLMRERAPEALPSQNAALPLLDPVPGFSLVSSEGTPVTLEALSGRYWVADFIFTRCTGVCPLLSGRMLAIQKGLSGRDDVRLVSFSVDPDYDTPEVLSAYAREHGADTSRWLFLTGSRDVLHALIGKGFHLAVSRAPDGSASPGDLITHSDRLVLVDRKGRIRGYYHGSETASVRRVLDDIDLLAGEE